MWVKPFKHNVLPMTLILVSFTASHRHEQVIKTECQILAGSQLRPRNIQTELFEQFRVLVKNEQIIAAYISHPENGKEYMLHFMCTHLSLWVITRDGWLAIWQH